MPFQAYNLSMRRFILPIILLTMALAGGGWYWNRTVVGAATAAPATPAGPGDVYLALGDSLAAGFTTNAPEDAYVARIAAAIRQRKPIQVRNLAVPGETSASMITSQLPGAIEFIKQQQQAGKRVSPITLDIGGNDGRRAERGTNEERRQTIAAIEKNIGTILDQLVAATTQSGQRTADIAIMTYYNPYPGDVTDQTTPAYWSTQLNAAIERAAKARGVKVADIAPAFAGGKVYRYTGITTGDIHANSAGHALIAEQFLQALDYNKP